MSSIHVFEAGETNHACVTQWMNNVGYCPIADSFPF